MNYTVIKSRRKTLALQIKGGELIVRAPMKISTREIENFVCEHKDWIEKHLEKSRERAEKAEQAVPLTDSEIKLLSKQAKALFAERAAHYAALIGVDYAKITVRRQKMRWGSCTGKGNLSFNLALMLAPPRVLDSVVVHELCHRKHMNHSPQFYSEMARVFPDYRECRRWLEENGSLLIAKVNTGR